MRVLLVTDWTAEEGGVEVYLELVAAALRSAGDDVALLTSSAGPADHADYRAFGTENRAAQAFLQIANPLAARDVRRAVADFRPDVVYVSMFEILLSPAIFAALRRVRTVLNIAYYKPVCPTGHKLLPDGSICQVRAGVACLRNRCLTPPRWLREQPRYALIRAAIESVGAIVTCSRFMRTELARAGVEAAWLPWPIEPPGPGFAPAPAATPLFVFTGRLSPEKGVDVLLRAHRLLRDRGTSAQLRVVGDGPERSRLEALAGSLGLGSTVEFVGRVPREEIESELAAAWALVAPSTWAEPLGLTALEAVVRGVPVVASATGGFTETVQPGVSGLLFRNGDAEALAERLAEVASGRIFPGHRASPAAAAAALAEHDLDTHASRLRELMKSPA
ncbi:MAG: glycosyltransferase family 4 protein [Gaiellaceae bacterium MAG52_C11]|nr:glycosyltransferase family 4 protein [Candidatus Gaiellasilicea maunaloa]